jgi:diguanylate cyclase (GGDEF)-like protein
MTMETEKSFFEKYDREFERAKRYGRIFSLCLISIANLKNFNLEEIHKVIKNSLRVTDYIFKYGDNEFILILTETDKKGTIHLCDRIIKKLIDLYQEREIKINCGVSTYKIDSTDKEALLEKCKNALENSQRISKNHIFAFKPLTKFSIEFFKWFDKTMKIKFKRNWFITGFLLASFIGILIILFTLIENLKIRRELLFEKAQISGNWKLVYEENFDKNVLQNWKINKGDWSIENGCLVARGRENYITLNKPVNGNIKIEFEAWIPRGNKIVQDLSCFIHNSEENITPKLYFFGFGEHKNTKTVIERLGKEVRRDYNVLISPGVKYKIIVESIDDTIKCSINDKLIFEYVDLFPLFSKKDKFFGLYSWGEGQHYDNIKIYTYEVGMSINVFQLGDDYFFNNSYDKAIEKYSEIFEAHKTTELGAKALYKIGLCYQLLNNKSKAIEIFDDIVKRYPKFGISAYSIIQKARVYVSEKEYIKGLKEVEVLHKMKNLGQIKEELEAFYFELLETTIVNYIYEISLEVCDKILKLNPYDLWVRGDILNIKVDIYTKLGDFKEAINICNEIMKNNYSTLIKLTATAKKYYLMALDGNIIESIKNFENIVTIDPKEDPEIKTVQLESFTLYFEILRDTRQIQRALKLIDKDLLDYPSFKEIQKELDLDYYKAQIFHAKGKYDLAIKYYCSSLIKNPKNQMAYLWLGDAFFSNGKIKKAKEYWQNLLNLIENEPKKREETVTAVNYLLGRTDINSIIKYVDNIKSIFTKSMFYYIIGLGLEVNGRKIEAIKYYNKSLEFFKVPVWPSILAAVKIGKYQEL